MGRGKNEKNCDKEDEVVVKRAVRRSVRKVKMSSDGVGKKPEQEVGKKRKRKAVRYEEDPSYIDEEVLEEHESEQQRKVISNC